MAIVLWGWCRKRLCSSARGAKDAGVGEEPTGRCCPRLLGPSSHGTPVRGVSEGERKLVTLLSCTLVVAPVVGVGGT